MSEPSDPSTPPTPPTPPTPTTPLILPGSISAPAVPISSSSTPTNPTGYEEIAESILHPQTHREPHVGTDSYNDGHSSQGLSHRSWSSISGGDLMDDSELARRRAERRRVRRHRLAVLNAQGELPETLKMEQTGRTPERGEVKEGGIPGLSADDEEVRDEEVRGVDKPRRSLEQSFRSKLFYYIPAFRWVPKYRREYFKGDMVAGITVGAMVVPQALAYAALAGLPPVVGLYTSFYTLLTYTLLGNCGQLSVAPDAMTAILVRSFLLELEEPIHEGVHCNTTIHNDTSNSGSHSTSSDSGFWDEGEAHWDTKDSLVIASGLSFLSGLILLILGIFRAGFIDNVLSRAVLRGFVTAAAIIIIIEQIPGFCAIPLPPESLEWKAHEKFVYFIVNFERTNLLNFFLGIGGVVFLYTFKFLKPRVKVLSFIPEIALLVIFGILFAYIGKFTSSQLPIIGSFGSAGFSAPRAPALLHLQFSQIRSLIPASMVISIIGFVESIICVKELTAKHHYQVSSNRELFALGASNVVASFFQSFPAFGSLPRSFVNHAAGARSPLSSFISAIIVALIILFLLPVFAFLPKVVMASVIIVAAVALIEVHDIIYMFKVRSWKQVALLTFVFLFTFFFGLELGVLICLSISLILVVKHTTLPRVLRLGITSDGKLRDLDEHPEADPTPGTLYLVLEDALYFANIGQVKTLVTEFVEEGQKELEEVQLQDTGSVHVSHFSIAPGKQLRLVLEFQRSVDLTALHALEEMLEELTHRGVELHLIGLSGETKEGLNRSGLMKHIPDEHVYGRKRQFLRKFMTIQDPRQPVFDTYQQAV